MTDQIIVDCVCNFLKKKRKKSVYVISLNCSLVFSFTGLSRILLMWTPVERLPLTCERKRERERESCERPWQKINKKKTWKQTSKRTTWQITSPGDNDTNETIQVHSRLYSFIFSLLQVSIPKINWGERNSCYTVKRFPVQLTSCSTFFSTFNSNLFWDCFALTVCWSSWMMFNVKFNVSQGFYEV